MGIELKLKPRRPTNPVAVEATHDHLLACGARRRSVDEAEARFPGCASRSVSPCPLRDGDMAVGARTESHASCLRKMVHILILIY